MHSLEAFREAVSQPALRRMQENRQRLRDEKVAQIEAISDAELYAWLERGQAPQGGLGGRDDIDFDEVRENIIESIGGRIVDGQPPSPEERNRENLSIVCNSPEGTQLAPEWFEERRQLPLPHAFDDSALDEPARVNPTVWPSAPPYVSAGGDGGLAAPWDMLATFIDLDAFLGLDPADDEASPRFADIPQVLVCVFGHAAAALRRLVRAGTLHVTLDVGDIVSFPRRMKADDEACKYELPLEEFDRIHLSNCPEYVRFVSSSALAREPRAHLSLEGGLLLLSLCLPDKHVQAESS